MNRTLFTILLACFCFSVLTAQSGRARRYFEKARQEIQQKEYGEALEELEKALEEDPYYVDALVLKADVHRQMDEGEKSLPLYEKAIRSGAPYYVLLFYGETLYKTGNFEEAMKVLTEYTQHPQANQKYTEQANSMIDNSRFAMEAVNKPVEYNPQNLGPKVNSEHMEYFPSISADGTSLVFTYRQMEGENQDEDFWVAELDTASGQWQAARPLQGFLNTRRNEGAQSITSDERIIYFAACERPEGEGSCDIYASFYEGNNQWSKPVNLGDKVNTRLWESQPSISSNGRTLYFVRGKNSYDKNIDIYYTTLGRDGRWTEARKLEGKVNTGGQETSPYIHFDDQHLYFSSNGHPGMGDLDFFVSERQADGTWGEPQNLGYPINTKGQEFSLIVAPDGKTGYFSSDNLQNGHGLLDLYSFQLPEQTQAIEIAYIRGKVINKKTREPISSKIEFSDLEQGKVVLEEASGRDGRYFAVLPSNSDYGLSIQKRGFLFYSKNFSLANETADNSHVLNVELVPIEVGKTVKLENIFFEYDSYELNKRSYSEINTVMEFMKENPSVKISIEGHTDSQGSASYNKTLSRNRAKSVYDYLVDKGVEASRLSYEGFGDTKPVATNETEEGRAMNRRTEMKITEY